MPKLKAATLAFLLATFAVSSCARGAGVTSRDSNSKSADPIHETRGKPARPTVNLNTATAQELIQLPGIGEVMAKRIIDYRERHGRFRRPEEIIIIEGFSERRYRAIADLVCVN